MKLLNHWLCWVWYWCLRHFCNKIVDNFRLYVHLSKWLIWKKWNNNELDNICSTKNIDIFIIFYLDNQYVIHNSIHHDAYYKNHVLNIPIRIYHMPNHMDCCKHLFLMWYSPKIISICGDALDTNENK